METETAMEIKKIRADLDLLAKLYAKLINRLIPEEEPEPEDIGAIKSRDKIVGEDELFKVLSK